MTIGASLTHRSERLVICTPLLPPGLRRVRERAGCDRLTFALRSAPLFALGFSFACADTPGAEPTPPGVGQVCLLPLGAVAPEELRGLGCFHDFEALASEKLDTSIPGARSVKVAFDRTDDSLYFQNSVAFPIHHAYAAAKLSGGEHPLVSSLSEFNETEYFSPDRRFILGAVTYYEGPKIWALEIAPYDTASAEMIGSLHAAVKTRVYFGASLSFHPTSVAVALEAAHLPALIPIKTTDEIFGGIEYQPLNLATATGQLRFLTADELLTTYVSYRDIVVLDHVPNDISVVSGIITEEFQTPLSHINVLSRNRRTPNMALEQAMSNETLRGLEGEWVELSVGPVKWTIRGVTLEEAAADWEARRPEPVILEAPDLSVTDLRDIEDVVVESSTVSLRDSIKRAIPAFGGKAAHFSILAKTEGLPVPKAFAIPAHYYAKFMSDHGFDARVEALLADPELTTNALARDQALARLRSDMHLASIDPTLEALLRAKMANEYPGLKLRFRSSTNSEDLDGFPCAGCYESHTGDPADWTDVLDAIRDTWATIWLFRTFEERAYNGIDHLSVVMALLVHHNFPDEEANGVAVTANPFDPEGLQPGFFVNVQAGGDVEVVHPPAGTTSDQFIYLYGQPGQPVSYLSHSNQLPEGATVLTTAQIHELGDALSKIHDRFSPAYGPASGNQGWYAMDVEFKFDGEPGETPRLAVKQARPYPASGL